MESSVKIVLIVAATVLLLVFGVIAVSWWAFSGTDLDSEGMAEIKAMPDIVTIYFNVETNGTDAQEAKDANALIVDNIKTALIKERFAMEDIQTQNFNIYPNEVWVNNKYVQKGYKAVHSLKLEFSTEKVEKIGAAIDAGVNAGASITSINFELSQAKQNEYKAEALRLATEDARNKAEAVAVGLGKEVGDVVSVSTSDFNYSPWRMYDMVSSGNAMEAKAAMTDIQPSTQDVSAQVSVTFELN